MADAVVRDLRLPVAGRQLTLRKFARGKSTIAFFMTLPLIFVVICLVIYPAFYAIHLATLNKSMKYFVGLGNFTFLFHRSTFWMVTGVLLGAAVPLVVYAFLMDYYISGVTAGATKG
jgi:multiple sugar transport system permease protein